MKNVEFRILSCCAATLLIASAASTLTIVVPTHQPTIQAAVNAATNGDTILVMDGVYSGPGNYNINMLGKAITLQSIGGPAVCTIDVQATQSTQRTGFIVQSGETSATVIRGFTITHGLQFNGPAMSIFSGSPTIDNCTFANNQANCWGGAVYFDQSSATFSNCRFLDNHSADDGGAVFGFNGSPTFTNCVFAGNFAPASGGAILIYGSGSDAPKLINSTVTGNQASFGAAMVVNDLLIENSIIWGNTGDDAQITSFSGTPITTAVNYSDVQGGWIGAGVGNINVAPQFVNQSGRDYHLMPGSMCIDAGNPAAAIPQGTLDFDGDPRLFGSHIDMGIDEFRKAGDINGDQMTNVDDLLAVIGAWGPCSWSMADLNHDFQVNVDDLLTVIANWG